MTTSAARTKTNQNVSNIFFRNTKTKPHIILLDEMQQFATVRVHDVLKLIKLLSFFFFFFFKTCLKIFIFEIQNNALYVQITHEIVAR
jgi:hypothetical protein